MRRCAWNARLVDSALRRHGSELSLALILLASLALRLASLRSFMTVDEQPHENVDLRMALADYSENTRYRQNAFRLSGLAIDASAEDAFHWDFATWSAEDQIIPVQPTPDQDDVGWKVSELEFPANRLAHELFWFWPLDAHDRAMDLVLEGRTADARLIWEDDVRNNEATAGTAASPKPWMYGMDISRRTARS